MPDRDDKCPLDDEELLAILRKERTKAVGYDNDGDLKTERKRALEYFKGEMNDVPNYEGRSWAVTTDVADAIRTLLPDLLDIFTGGDDVATFIPTGPEDEKAAKQETDYLKKVIFQDNDGFHTLYTMIQDALQVKLGVVTYYWEEFEPEEEVLEGKTEIEAMGIDEMSKAVPPRPAIPANPEMGIEAQPEVPEKPSPYEIIDITAGDEPNTFDITIKKPTTGKVCIRPVPPEDAGAAQDTIRLPKATYAGFRSRPRAQQLIADGHDPDKVEMLPAYGTPGDQADAMARDTAGEHAFTAGDGSSDHYRQVEIYVEFLQILNGKKLEIWKITSGGGATVLLEKEKVEAIQLAAMTPFPVSHRLYGESVADLLMDHQKITTALTRATLDSVYFAQNQRMEVATASGRADENTIADVLRNEPGVPIRSKDGNSVRPIVAGAPNVDFMGALEYFATIAERRTGIVRNAQGLNPDTLHETAKGALALMSLALKRMRLVARIFAETGIKDLFLGVHALIRQHSTRADQMRFAGDWVQVDPSTWGERSDMSIEIGLGSGGKDQEIAMLLQEAEMMQRVVEVQQGAEGPVVTWENIANLLTRFFEVTGRKQPEKFVSDPSKAPPKPPQPDPKAIEAQARAQEAQQQLQIQHAKNQGDAQLAQAKAGADMQLQQAKAQSDATLAQQRMTWEADLKERTTQAELAMKWQIAQAELEQQRVLNEQKAQMDREHNANMADVARSKIEAQVRVGGEPG